MVTGPPNPPWPASWITHPSALVLPGGVFLFRRSFSLASPLPPGSRFRVRISADHHYELFLNGARLGEGPGSGDPEHWPFREVDLAPALRLGENVLAAVVFFHNPAERRSGQMGVAPVLVVAGHPEDAGTEQVHTPAEWRCRRDDSRTWCEAPEGWETAATGPGERFVLAGHPWGWELPGYDAAGWESALPLWPAFPRGARRPVGPYLLEPPVLPSPESGVEALEAVVRAEGVMVMNHRLAPDAPLLLPAGGRIRLLLDLGRITSGYPEVVTDGGAGARLLLRYADGLRAPDGGLARGLRADLAGGKVLGLEDEWLLDGEPRKLRPLGRRTFRFVEVEANVEAQPLRLHGVTCAVSTYPLTEKARFSASDESLARIVEVSARTLRLSLRDGCAIDAARRPESSPGDARVQALLTYYLSGDPRPARNALHQFDHSRVPEGLTRAHYPHSASILAPPASLEWIGMLYDYWRHVDDEPTVALLLPGTRGVLHWFLTQLSRRREHQGLLGPLPWWNEVDREGEWPEGVPPGAEEGGGAVVSLLLVRALREAAEMERALGQPHLSGLYRDHADRLVSAVRRRCWNPTVGWLADSPGSESYSELGQALALQLGVLGEGDSRRLAARLAARLAPPPPREEPAPEAPGSPEKPAAPRGERPPTGMPPPEEPPPAAVEPTSAGLTRRFELHRAIVDGDPDGTVGEGYVDWLGPWQRLLRRGTATWPADETAGTQLTTAAAGHPALDLLAVVLGVRSVAPGFREIELRPHLGALAWVEGTLPHPAGTITVRIERRDGIPQPRVTLPRGVRGTLVYRGRRSPLTG